MPVPAELQIALDQLKRPLRFGDQVQIFAIEMLQQWQEVACLKCDQGRVISRVFGRPEKCRTCDGTGKVWVKR